MNSEEETTAQGRMNSEEENIAQGRMNGEEKTAQRRVNSKEENMAERRMNSEEEKTTQKNKAYRAGQSEPPSKTLTSVLISNRSFYSFSFFKRKINECLLTFSVSLKALEPHHVFE